MKVGVFGSLLRLKNHTQNTMKTSSLSLILCFTLGLLIATPCFPVTADNSTDDELGWTFEYDDNGRITTANDPGGRTTQIKYSFDEANRLQHLIRTTTDGPSIIYKFDERGRRSAMTDAAGTVFYEYDDLDRLYRIQRQGAPVIAYTHDTLDRIKSLQVDDFYRIEYNYDFLGRLESMTTPAGVIRYEYLTGEGKLVRTLPNGVVTISSYEPNGELSQISHGLTNTNNDTHYTVLAEYTYQYRPDGLIEAIQERSGNSQFLYTYLYDNVGRLVNATGPAGQQYTYKYDLVGNRLNAVLASNTPQNLTYDWAGRLKSFNGKPCVHDAAGNLVAMTVDDKTLTYRYNSDNQLTEVPEGNVSYRYDGEGQLIARKLGNNEVTIVPDPLSDYWQPLVIANKEGHRTLVIWEGSIPLIMIRDGKPEYLLHDHLGSVRLVLNSHGKVTQHFEYDPYGTDKTSSADFAPRFAGLFWDPQANVYLTRGRAYSPQLGRFLQIDPQHRVPFGSQKDLSIYNYCGNDPVNFVDRDGAEPIEVISLPMDYTNFIERDHIMNQLVTKAWDKPYNGPFPKEQRNLEEKDLDWDNEITRVYWKALQWRTMYTDAPEKFIQEFPDINTRPTYAEIRNVENQLYAQMVVETGKHRPPFTKYNKPAGVPSSDFLIKKGIPRWAKFHSIVDSPVGKFLHLDKFLFKEGSYPQGPLTKERQLMGVNAGLNALAARDAEKLFVQGIGENYSKHSYTPSPSTSTSISFIKFDKPKLPYQKRQDALSDTNKLYWFGGGGLPPPPPPDSGWGGGTRLTRINFGGNNWGGNSWRNNGWQGDSWSDPDSAGNQRLTPAKVGGIYLGGAGNTLTGLGLVDGITLDDNNNLVLLGKAGQQIKLPSLRLDDVVTVFRSVYIHGEGPTVTIDPNPENPEGSAMIIRHGKATENTYVGWVLFQADRLMKGYTLGIDNVTTQEISSTVPGYDNVLNTIYFGGESPEKLRKQGHWERFWIVPDEVRRFGSGKRALTLFEVPLKVKTQSMQWENDKLVDDTSGKSSPGALAFTNWFTNQYDLIAHEQLLTPPHESGITEPVAVFTELRRIALITAIAEMLRDQGVPMPFWMRDYDVQTVPFEKFTPGLEVTRSNQRLIARLYGGVQLSPDGEAIRDFTARNDLSRLPEMEQKIFHEKITQADSLEQTVRVNAPASEPLKVRQFTHKGFEYQTVALPGAATHALAPCRLEEVDLSVTIEGDYSIQLARSYNSFFNPNGPWGRGWAFDLPRLESVKVPVRREGSEVLYQTAFELITPLNSTYARFSRIEAIAELANNQLLVSDQPSDFFGLADDKPEFLSVPTRKLIRKDGGAWYFSKAGSLVATEQDGFRTVFERDTNGHMTRIVGLLGRQPLAFIELDYNASGRLESAKARRAGDGSTESIVSYEYDDGGRLTTVISESGKLGYQYQGSWVTAVTHQIANRNEKVMLRSFEYNSKGQLLNDVNAEGVKTAYRVTSDSQGSIITANKSGNKSEADSIRYDQSFRPMEAKYADGTRGVWDYSANKGTVLVLTEPDGETVKFIESADQRHRTLEINQQHQISSEYDSSGRMISLAENGRTLLQQKWSPNGRLQTANSETYAEHFAYDDDGLISSIIAAPPDEHDQFKHWQETKLDTLGRPAEIKDYRGLHISIGYEESGELAGMITHRNGKNYGFNLTRDNFGGVQEVQSSWGKQQYSYDTTGFLTKMKINKDGVNSSIEWKSGQLHAVKQFDGGNLSLTYYEDNQHAGLLKQITTPNELMLTYQYDATNQLRTVAIGKEASLELEYNDRGYLTGWRYRAAKK